MSTVNEPQSAAPDAELDLESQLDALLDQIDQAEPGLVARKPAEPAAALAVAVAEPPAAAEPPVDADSDAGLDLASQIQQLLDDARTQQPSSAFSAVAEPAGTPVAEAAVPPQPEPVVAPQPASLSPAAQTPDTAMASETLNIEAIDQMLADEADQALAGDFETITEVLATENLPEVSAPAQRESAAPVASAVSAPPTGEEEDDLEGSFEEPETVLQAATASADTGLSEDAKAVARELDDQPENRSRASRAGDSQDTVPPAASDRRRAARPSAFKSLGRTVLVELKALPELLRVACEAINRPLAALTPHTRDMVGYAGLITVFWGSVTLVGKLVSVLMG